MRSKIELKNNISTDTVNEDIYGFGNGAAPLVDNNGIHKIGGIINTQETETALPTGKSFFTDDGKRITVSNYATDTIDVSVDGRSMGQLPEYGVETKVEVSSTYDDVALTADGTYITAKLFGNAVTLSEYDFNNVLLHSRVITFTSIGSIAQYVTSFSIVKYQNMHYADSAEFAIRIGDQILIAPESNPGVSLAKYFQSSSVIGTNNVLCSIVYNGALVIAGVGGRLGSYDGNNWRNYDGSGLGQGPASNAVAIGANDINCMIIYQGLLVVAGAGGRVASYDGISWRNYDGTGGSSSVIFDNGTLIGTNAIKCMGIWNNIVVFGGVGGRIGSIYQGTKYIYTASATTLIPGTTIYPILSNGTICGTNDINSMGTITKSGDEILCIMANGGRVGSYNYAFTSYTGALVTNSLDNWIARTSIASTGSGWQSVAYGNGTFVVVALNTSTNAVQTSSDGITWTQRTCIAASSTGWGAVTYGNGLFVAVAFNNSATGAVQTSPDGITWTSRNAIAASGAGWYSITYANGLFVAVALSTSTTNTVMTSPDGITWTAQTCTAATGSGWRSVTYGNGLFVTVSSTTSTSGAVQTSPDGVTWTARTSNAATGSGWSSVTFGGGVFVAAAYSTSTSGAIQTSTDGITWTPRTSTAAGGIGWVSITYGSGFFVAVAQNSTTTGTIQSSPDGITWTARTCTAGNVNGWRSITYGENTFITVGNGTTTTGVVQTTGIFPVYQVWNNSTALSTDNINTSYIYNNNLVMASALGKIASYDGTNWKNYDGTGTGTSIFNNATVLGAVSINDIILFGTNLLFAGNTSRIGSWDGSNWKNYDGSGTGTGQFTSNILGTQNINTIDSYGGQIIAGGVGGVVNSMSSASVVSPFYNVSGLPVAQNILAGQVSAGYLDAYRYENGLYLLGVVGNNLNKYYVLNNSTLDLVLLNGKYALVQVSGGNSRHIITETPRFDGSRMYFISLVGYTDFVNFSASQVYPADASILSSVLNSQIGWNYADFTYKLTSSSTSIFNALAPIPIPAPASLYKTFQSNTNTLTTAYGKLNNAVGVPSTKPFEFRLNWLNSGVSTVGSQQFISVASLDGGITDSLGVIVTDVGAFDDSYTPQIVNDDTILYKYNGKWYIIRISKNISTRIQRIASTLYKINTISPLNIVDTTTETLNVGSCDYQGRMQFTSAVVPAATNTKCVSVFTGKFSNSIDNGDRLVQIPSLSQNNIDLIGFRIPNTNRIIQNYSIDTFINDTYAFTTYNDASEFVQSDPANPLYLPNSNLPIPIGGIYNNGAVTSKSLTVFLGENYDGYKIGNDLPYAYTPFSLFGQQYLFDGLAIYIANIQNNILQSTDKICEAYGMMYIAVTPAEAFFLSDFDNSLYSFNGGRTLVKTKAFTTLDVIDSGVWSTVDGTMLLNGTNSFIWVRDGICTKIAKKPTQTNLKFYTTQNGIIIANDNYSWQYTYYPQVGSLPLPLTFQTAYFGQENNQLSVLKRWIITIYNTRKDVLHITTTEKSKDQDCQYSHQSQFILTNADYDALGYAHIRVTPKHPRALGSSIIIHIAELAAVLDVTAEWEDSATAAISAGKSR